ncbi:hypothetical protein C8F01DRAFT_1352539, partial [Mycena amicta]
ATQLCASGVIRPVSCRHRGLCLAASSRSDESDHRILSPPTMFPFVHTANSGLAVGANLLHEFSCQYFTTWDISYSGMKLKLKSSIQELIDNGSEADLKSAQMHVDALSTPARREDPAFDSGYLHELYTRISRTLWWISLRLRQKPPIVIPTSTLSDAFLPGAEEEYWARFDEAVDRDSALMAEDLIREMEDMSTRLTIE